MSLRKALRWKLFSHFQVEALQEGIARLRSDIKEAKGRGEEKERQQREQGRNSKEALSNLRGF